MFIIPTIDVLLLATAITIVPAARQAYVVRAPRVKKLEG
jgi:hypothetical protein